MIKSEKIPSATPGVAERVVFKNLPLQIDDQNI